jgi:hypothetical protein
VAHVVLLFHEEVVLALYLRIAKLFTQFGSPTTPGHTPFAFPLLLFPRITKFDEFFFFAIVVNLVEAQHFIGVASRSAFRNNFIHIHISRACCHFTVHVKRILHSLPDVLLLVGMVMVNDIGRLIGQCLER